MEIFKNPGLDCSDFDFFDSLIGIDYEFILTDTADFISIQPALKFEATYQSNVNTETYNFDGTMPAPDNLKIKVTMDADQ